MSDEPDTFDALERICWYLAYREGEEVSAEEIAEATDLSWATVQKSLVNLNRLQRILPNIRVDSSDVTVGEPTEPAASMKSDPVVAAVVYLFNQSVAHGDPTDAIPREGNEWFFEEYADALDNAIELDWIEHTDDGVRLTPVGVQVAGPARSEVAHQIPDE